MTEPVEDVLKRLNLKALGQKRRSDTAIWQ
jgi:hypothetical protein